MKINKEQHTIIDPVLDAVDEVMADAGRVLDRAVDPSRKLLIKRFPTTFALIGLFGLAATDYAFERFIETHEFLNNHPFLILLIGLAALFITGYSVREWFKQSEARNIKDKVLL